MYIDILFIVWWVITIQFWKVRTWQIRSPPLKLNPRQVVGYLRVDGIIIVDTVKPSTRIQGFIKKKKTKDSRSRLAPTPNHCIFVWGPIYNNNLVYKSISKRFDILRICMNKLLRNIVYEELRLQRDVLDLKKHASKFLSHLINRTLEYHIQSHRAQHCMDFYFFIFFISRIKQQKLLHLHIKYILYVWVWVSYHFHFIHKVFF